MDSIKSFIQERKKAIIQDVILGLEYEEIAAKYDMSVRNIHYHTRGKITPEERELAQMRRLVRKNQKEHEKNIAQ